MADQQQRTSQSQIERLRSVIRWRVAAAVGFGTWILGFAATVAVLLGFDVDDHAGESGPTLAAWAFYEGIGGVVTPDIGTAPATVDRYLLVDSELLAPGIIIHMLLPAVLFVLAGYLLADRHTRHSSAIEPIETVLGGTTFVIVFAPLSVITTLTLGAGDASIGVAQAVVVSILYPAVFAAVGAASRVRIRITSLRGFLGGIAAFVVGIAAWGVLTKPLADSPARRSLSDFDGLEYFQFAQDFIGTHGIEGGGVVPGLYVVVLPLVLGAVIAYRRRTSDPLVGSGRGARLGFGYVLPVAVVVVGYVLAEVRDISESVEGAWPQEQVEAANALIGVAPRPILLGGVVFPVVFAAVGGGVGAVGYAIRNPDARASDDEREESVQRQRQPRSEHRPEQHQRQQQQQKERRQQQQPRKQPHQQSQRHPQQQPRKQPHQQSHQEPSGREPQQQQQQPQNRDSQSASDSQHEQRERRKAAQSGRASEQPSQQGTQSGANGDQTKRPRNTQSDASSESQQQPSQNQEIEPPSEHIPEKAGQSRRTAQSGAGTSGPNRQRGRQSGTGNDQPNRQQEVNSGSESDQPREHDGPRDNGGRDTGDDGGEGDVPDDQTEQRNEAETQREINGEEDGE